MKDLFGGESQRGAYLLWRISHGHAAARFRDLLLRQSGGFGIYLDRISTYLYLLHTAGKAFADDETNPQLPQLGWTDDEGDHLDSVQKEDIRFLPADIIPDGSKLPPGILEGINTLITSFDLFLHAILHSIKTGKSSIPSARFDLGEGSSVLIFFGL